MNGQFESKKITCPRCGSERVKWATPIYQGWWLNGNYYSSRRMVCLNCGYEFGPEARIHWSLEEEMGEEGVERIRRKIIQREYERRQREYERKAKTRRKEFKSSYARAILIIIVTIPSFILLTSLGVHINKEILIIIAAILVIFIFDRAAERLSRIL